MTERELTIKLNELRSMVAENEIVEFKEAKNDYTFEKIGKYFSALSNEANLKGVDEAWLVFGIEDKQHEIVGTNYRLQHVELDSLKSEVANKTTNRITFIDIHELITTNGRVVMFQIPSAPKGIPIAWEGHYYGRDGEKLSPLNINEIERIRSQSIIEDWSSVIIPEATIDDLDEKAILLARDNFKNKNPKYDVESWDDITFLNKAKITVKGQITRTAIILLGKSEADYYISPSVAKIRWVLIDSKGNKKDYQIESCPLILSIENIHSRIRNLKYRYLKEGTLFPDEVQTYEPFIIREAINNCIAHQDYTKAGMIDVIEKEDQLIFSNLGSFIPGSIENVINDNAPEKYYRNQFLCTAMYNLMMVDTIGSGIRKMFNYQRDRFFPMPDYDLTAGKVEVTIMGKVLDIEYARILAKNKDLTLQEIIILDKVQKKKELTTQEEKHLKKKRLIEGRKPNFYLSAYVAQKTGQKAEYIKNKAFDKTYYFDLIQKAINVHGFVDRQDINSLLWKKLPDWMDDKQKKIKINNLISEMREKGIINNKGTDSKPKWFNI